MPKFRRIDGGKILRLQCLGSKYDHGVYINVFFDDNGKERQGRITTTTLLALVDDFTFKVREPDGRMSYPRIEEPRSHFSQLELTEPFEPLKEML